MSIESVDGVKTAVLPPTEVRPIDTVVPYWRNPRRIPTEAVEALRHSIATYGYVQAIVVDTDGVVIVGHTRLQALRQMGETEVPVYVSSLTPEKAKEYRLVDNRTGELTMWDPDALFMELREWERGLVESYFPDVDLEIKTIQDAVRDVTPADIAKAVDRVEKIKDREILLTTDVCCPACLDSFPVDTRSLPGLSRLDLEQLEVRAAAVSNGGEAV